MTHVLIYIRWWTKPTPVCCVVTYCRAYRFERVPPSTNSTVWFCDIVDGWGCTDAIMFNNWRLCETLSFSIHNTVDVSCFHRSLTLKWVPFYPSCFGAVGGVRAVLWINPKQVVLLRFAVQCCQLYIYIYRCTFTWYIYIYTLICCNSFLSRDSRIFIASPVTSTAGSRSRSGPAFHKGIVIKSNANQRHGRKIEVCEYLILFGYIFF